MSDSETVSSARQQQMQQQTTHNGSDEQDARFSCSICFDPVREPVVTQCGHLYCWPCLYRWLSPGMTPQERRNLGLPRAIGPMDESRRTCPVCKSEASARTIIPIYVQNTKQETTESILANTAQLLDQQQQRRRRRLQPTTLSHREDQSANPQLPLEREEENLLTSSPSIFRQTIDHHYPASRPDDPDDIDDSVTENMGLNIDDDDDEEDMTHSNSNNQIRTGLDQNQNVPTTITTTVPSSASPDTRLGLRQRRVGSSGLGTRTESRDDMNMETDSVVPTRPGPYRDRTVAAATAEANSNTRDSPSSPPRNFAVVIPGNDPMTHHHARATLSHGLVLAMHRALLSATNPHNNQNNNNNHSSGGNPPNGNIDEDEYIPSLHYPTNNRDSNNSSPIPNGEVLDADPETTVFLSRLLVGLSLFVFFCLLSF